MCRLPGLHACVSAAQLSEEFVQIETYNGAANLTAYPGLPFPLANTSVDGTPYQGLLFPSDTRAHPGYVGLASFDLVFDRVVAAEGTGVKPVVQLPAALCWRSPRCISQVV